MLIRQAVKMTLVFIEFLWGRFLWKGGGGGLLGGDFDSISKKVKNKRKFKARKKRFESLNLVHKNGLK